MTLSVDENSRRFEIYRQGGTVKEQASRASLSPQAWQSWMKLRQLTIVERVIERKTVEYLHRRPEWERKRMRHFGDLLFRAAAGLNGELPDVGAFINEYRKQYGECSQ